MPRPVIHLAEQRRMGRIAWKRKRESQESIHPCVHRGGKAFLLEEKFIEEQIFYCRSISLYSPNI